jgi:hypothetical protein
VATQTWWPGRRQCSNPAANAGANTTLGKGATVNLVEWEPDLSDNVGMMRAKLLKQFGDAVAKDAVRLAPVDTGLLKSEIHANDDGSRVTANTDYAAPVEFGHRVVVSSEYGTGEFYEPDGTVKYVPAQPYLRPAAYRPRDFS